MGSVFAGAGSLRSADGPPLCRIKAMWIFRFFETLLQPTALSPEAPPPQSLMAFYWHYARQVRGLIAALFVAGCAVALLDTTIPIFIGRVVTLASTNAPDALFRVAGWQLLGMAAVLLVLRPSVIFTQNLIVNQTVSPGFTNLIRWQNHWHVVRQSWTFFQNDFAGRKIGRASCRERV